MAIAVTKNQVPKLAAMEGNWKDTSCAPLYIVGWVDEGAQKTYAVGVPCLLSFLSYGNFHATVPGLAQSTQQFPRTDWPPVNLTFQAYHVMIDLGFLFPLIGVVGWLYWRKRRDTQMPRATLWAFVATVFLAEVATIAGWWTAEIGRQPWIVWNVLRTSDAVSPTLRTDQALTSLIMFALLYLLLLVLFVFLLDRKIKRGPEPVGGQDQADALPNTVRELFRSAREPRAHAEEVEEPVSG
jgi:cytochrome d ubiquinol oxidase subunit I